ncbi:hypothetical protein AURDEDRAFT_116271 [Auricularia subglabra TFB-10046 SS5]|uniref:Uncharacterized protein n=1 Tax=Auricularia subglabra (strain TFB-10046 / SS5) TaxID=717982 RepID=J0WVM1_AURST|nr:hypothetical protein AURDEDRAFT_116271 [Auricularia subglabra TFB-10046 SS5]
MARLADELLEWILAPPLHVPDEMFADPGPVSPFSRATFSASDVLLVCKSWMRVATPALYATVVIRSTAQAQALALALSRNPQFGRYVRKLRLEGAYGEYTREFIQHMRYADDFCFALSVRSSDDIGGLDMAFRTLNPTRVILTLPPLRDNPKYRALLSKLAAALVDWRWTVLKEFSFTRGGEYQVGGEDHLQECTYAPDLVQALSKLPYLETVRHPASYRSPMLPTYPGSDVGRLLSNTAIKFLILYCPRTAPRATPSLPESMMSRLYLLPPGATHPTKFGARSTVEATSTSDNPFYRPLNHLTRDARVEIWSKILSFVITTQPTGGLWVHGEYSPDSASFTRGRIDRRTTRSLVRVSKDFKDAALRAILARVCISDAEQFKFLTSMFARISSSDKWVEWLRLQPFPHLTSSELERVFRTTTNVRSFAADGFRPDLFPAFQLLFLTAGRSIRSLVLADVGRLTRHSGLLGSAQYPGHIFKDLVVLEHLDWDVEHISFDMATATNQFPELRSLAIRRSHSSFVELLAKCSLPKLSHLVLGQGFMHGSPLLESHGAKIGSISAHVGLHQDEFDACPALHTLELSQDATASALSGLRHAHLSTIKLRWPIDDGTKWINRYRTFGKGLSSERLPSLKSAVVVQQKDIWPSTEQEIARSPWPKIYALFSANGVSLLDHTHRAWRPRLQVQ